METVNLTSDGNELRSLQQNPEVIDEQIVESDINCVTEKKKIKSISALSAAAVCRSAVQHAHLHIISNRPGDFAHSATNISYNI